MRRLDLAIALSASIPLLTLAGSRGPAAAGEVIAGGRTFRVADGFVVELVAAPPLVDRPIVADFDELGRLYVADSSGSNESPKRQLANPTHRIVRLEDSDGDGRFDRRVVFADRMMFPEGAMWRGGSLYVAAPPSIWKLTDTDGDGMADAREEWFRGKTLTGCANDLHGPYDGPDGWIYWCKGAFEEQTIDRPGRPPLKTRASHIFRARPDGSGVEPVMTGGMDNPVEVAFTQGGERLFTATFVQHPAGGRRDGLLHAVYGGVYGKDHDAIDGHPRSGPDLMPVMTHLGPAAPSGLVRAESDRLGEGYRHGLFAALFNLHKVTRHVLEPDGSTFRSVDSDFLAAADDLDFHPTDVLEDADGSLLVLDTGGWYKLCCPTSQIGKPDVLGAIYRVRRASAATLEDPRGLKLPWAGLGAADLVGRLADRRPAVRRRATASLAEIGPTAVPSLELAARPASTIEARIAAIHVASSIDHPAARGVARLALRDRDEVVRQAAAHAVGLWRDRDAIRPLVELLSGPSPQNARVAAEALGRLGESRVVADLLAAARRAGSDRVLEHSIISAAIEIGSVERAADSLESEHPEVRRAAMIAVDQIGGEVPPDTLKEALISGGRGGEAAEWILARHPDRCDLVAAFLRDALEPGRQPSLGSNRLERLFARFAHADAVRDLLGERLKDQATGRDIRLALLRAQARSGLGELPQSWREGLDASILGEDPEVSRLAVSTARALALPGDQGGHLSRSLRKVAESARVPADVRLEAFQAIPGGVGLLSSEQFAFIREQLAPDRPVSARLAAADILASAKLDDEQLGGVAEALRTAGPLEAARLLGAFRAASGDAIGRTLIASLKNSSALASFRVESLRPQLAGFSDAVKPEAESLYALIERDAADQKTKLDDLLATMPEGDLRRGQAVFNGPKAACTSCHAIGYLGGNVGPDLSKVGSIRGARDLLESIVYPSASFVRSYEPMLVATSDGRVHSGILRKNSADDVVLAIAADKELRIPRSDVEEMKPGSVSVMPAGLEKQISKQDLADLLAFLKSRR